MMCRVSEAALFEEGPVYRVFLSHAVEDFGFAQALATALAAERLFGFLAPTDIVPGTECISSLEGELRRCGALVALITPAFQRSKWCDHEVGYAMGLGHPVVPVRIHDTDPPPYGLLGRYQAITVDGRGAPAVAAEILDALLAHEHSRPAAIDTVLDSLAHHREATRVSRYVDRLARIGNVLSDDQRSRIAQLAERHAVLRLDSDMRTRLSGILEQ